MLETKRFIGNNMDRLYDRVRQEFGPDAVIVRTRTIMREGADPLIEQVAAAPQPEQDLSLDLQWTMVDGALGRLQIARPRATVGDLEEMVAAESTPVSRLPGVGLPLPPASPPDWLEGYVDAAPAAPGDRTAGRRGALQPHVRRRTFANAADIPEVEPPPAAWATRQRPSPPGPSPEAAAGREPLAPAFGASAGQEQWANPGGGWGRHTDDIPALPRRPRPVTGPESILVAAGVSPVAAYTLLAAGAPGSSARSALISYFASHTAAYPDEGVTAIITVQGAPGSGRTTALIRMALDCADTGRATVLVAADTTRAAAREMLHAYGEATGIDVLDATAGDGLAATLRQVPHGACAFVDIPPGQFEPPSLNGAVNYAFITLPATWQPAALKSALAVCDLGSMAGCIPTFVDMATDLSPILSLAIEAGLPLAFLSSGRDVSSGIEVVDPVAIASGVLPITTRETTDGRLVASA